MRSICNQLQIMELRSSPVSLFFRTETSWQAPSFHNRMTKEFSRVISPSMTNPIGVGSNLSYLDNMLLTLVYLPQAVMKSSKAQTTNVVISHLLWRLRGVGNTRVEEVALLPLKLFKLRLRPQLRIVEKIIRSSWKLEKRKMSRKLRLTHQHKRSITQLNYKMVKQ